MQVSTVATPDEALAWAFLEVVKILERRGIHVRIEPVTEGQLDREEAQQ